MNYVEMVVKIIKDKGYNITQNPQKATLRKENQKQLFSGSYLEVEYESFWGIRKYRIFISNKVDAKNYHDGNHIFKGTHLPSIIWFKEIYDKITIFEGLLI